jgi:3-hydroxy-9,10-secoandrosta-1,3,5(10)-triene-9,17-dione monooxygenase reductase component
VTVAVDDFKGALAHFCTGVAVITGRDGVTPAGFTCQSFTAVSLKPPLILICPSRTSVSWPVIRAGGHFVVNILSSAQQPIAQQFAVSGGNKFAGISWRPGVNGCPRIDRCVAYVECRISDELPAGDHTIVVGIVQQLQLGDHDAPLLYYRSAYAKLGRHPQARASREHDHEV